MTCFRLTAALARKLISKTQDFCVNQEDFFEISKLFLLISAQKLLILVIGVNQYEGLGHDVLSRRMYY